MRAKGIQAAQMTKEAGEIANQYSNIEKKTMKKGDKPGLSFRDQGPTRWR